MLRGRGIYPKVNLPLFLSVVCPPPSCCVVSAVDGKIRHPLLTKQYSRQCSTGQSCSQPGPASWNNSDKILYSVYFYTKQIDPRGNLAMNDQIWRSHMYSYICSKKKILQKVILALLSDFLVKMESTFNVISSLLSGKVYSVKNYMKTKPVRAGYTVCKLKQNILLNCVRKNMNYLERI